MIIELRILSGLKHRDDARLKVLAFNETRSRS
jgi:hypothetical protein